MGMFLWVCGEDRMNKKEAIKLLHDLDDCYLSSYPPKKTLKDLGMERPTVIYFAGMNQYNRYIDGIKFGIKHCFNIKESDLK